MLAYLSQLVDQRSSLTHGVIREGRKGKEELTSMRMLRTVRKGGMVLDSPHRAL